MLRADDRAKATWLALILFGVYVFTYSGQIFSADGMSMFSVTESAIKRGDFSTDQLWTLFKSRNEIAADGESYAKYGFGTSLLIAPLYALAWVLPGIGLVQTTILGSAIAIALAGALVFLAARRLGFSPSVSAFAALLFGLATPAWVYARELWSEPYGLVTLFAAFYFLLCYRDKSHQRDAIIAGIFLALAVSVRLTNAALVPVFVWYLATPFTATREASPRPPARSENLADEGRLRAFVAAIFKRQVLSFTVPIIIALLLTAGYDWTRFGNPLATGYRVDETFDNPILLGLYGLLFSPGKGLFIYVPFLAALPFSFAQSLRRAKNESILIAIIFTFYVSLFSAWYYWWGGTSWATRFLVPTLPFLILAIAPAIELALRRANKIFSAIFFALCALSVAIEIIGISLPALAYRVRMVRLSSNPEMDAVFIPSLSPVVGYFNLLKPTALNFAWMRVIAGSVVIDWVMIGLAIVFIAYCVWRMIAVRRPPSTVHGIILIMALAIIVLYRVADDPHFDLGNGYAALLQFLRYDAQANDVMILGDDARTPQFLNANRASPRWYGLSRDPKQFDEATQTLLTRLAKNYSRVWFVFDDSAADLDHPIHDWLDQNLSLVTQNDFDDGVHLIQYQSQTTP